MNPYGVDQRYQREYLQKLQQQSRNAEQPYGGHHLASSHLRPDYDNYRPSIPSQDRYSSPSFPMGIHSTPMSNHHSIPPGYRPEQQRHALTDHQPSLYQHQQSQSTNRYSADNRSFDRSGPVFDREIPFHLVQGHHASDFTGHMHDNRNMFGNPPLAQSSALSAHSHLSPRHNIAMPPGTGGSNAQGRAINKMLLEIVRDRVIDPQRLHLAIETFVDRMDCVNLATLLFHTGKKRFLLAPVHVKMIANRLNSLNEELRAREASNSLYGLKCLSSEIPEVRELVYALANKITLSASDFVAQAVGNALYGMQMMSSEYEEVRYLLLVLSAKVSQCTDLLEAQNVGNALYGLRGMNSDHKEVRAVISALTPKVARAKEELNGQALGNSLYGLQNMSSKESEVRCLLTVLAAKVTRTWEELKAQEVGNALYGLKRMSSDVSEVRSLIAALVPKIASSPELLDAQAIGNSFYGLQNMKSDNPELLTLLGVLAEKVVISHPELDGQAMGNSLYGLQGMSSEYPEVRAAISALTIKIQNSMLEMNAQELGNALYGLQNMTTAHKEVRSLLLALAQKISLSKHDLTSQEIGNSLFGLQGMSSEYSEARILLSQLSMKIAQSHSALDPQGVSNTLFGFQRLSSESHEVRGLLQAVSHKIEHCWKVLSSHHLAHACYGLQCLSSEHPEVRMLLKGFVSKVAACREEMTAKQLSAAVFGMQHLNGNHGEVRVLATVLAEKITLSVDLWTPSQIALAMFGLQGFNSDIEETNVLLNVLNFKMSSMIGSLLEMEPIMLGNWLYGMQRMSSNNIEVAKMLTLLTPYLQAMHTQLDRLTPLIFANMLFGIQGCSCLLEPVQLILELVLAHVLTVTDLLRKRSPRKPSASDVFHEYICLFQSMCLSLSVMPDLQSNNNNDLYSRCIKSLSDMEHTIADLFEFYCPRALTAAENNLAKEVQEVARDGFKVKRAALVGGFDCAISLEALSASPLRSNETKLILEVVGSSYCYPAKELFCHLRRQYVTQVKGIPVKTLSAQAFTTYSPQTLALAKHYPDILATIRNAMEEQGIFGNVSKGLDMMGFDRHATGSVSFTGSEYYDDELRFHVDQANSATSVVGSDILQQHYSVMPRRPVYQRKPFGMMMGWLGEWPVLSNLQHGTTAGASQQQLLRYVTGNAAAATSSGASGLPGSLGMPLNSASTSPRISSISGNINNSTVSLAAMQMMMRPMLEQRGMMHANDLLSTADPASAHRLASTSGTQFGKLGSSDSTLLLDSTSGSAYNNSNSHTSNNVNRLHHIPNTLSHTLDDQDSIGSVHSGDMLASLTTTVGGKSFESSLSVNHNINNNNNNNIANCTTPMSRAVMALSAPSASQSFYNDGLLSSTDMLSSGHNMGNFTLSNNLDNVLTLSALSLDTNNNSNNLYGDMHQIQSRQHSSSHDSTGPSHPMGSGSENNSAHSSAAVMVAMGNGTADIADIIS